MWPNKKKTLIMGILNITPDSFSDGGSYQNLEEIVARAKQMVEDGADIIDVGGESTRPGSVIVDVEEELARVIPVIKKLVKEVNVPISIDTYKAEVARKAVEAGAMIINDIGGAKFDPLMPEVMAKSGAYVVLMHNRKPDLTQTDCITATSGELTEYDDIVDKVREELKESIYLVPTERGLLPNICNLRWSVQSGRPHPVARAWLQGEEAAVPRPEGHVGPGQEATSWALSSGSLLS